MRLGRARSPPAARMAARRYPDASGKASLNHTGEMGSSHIWLRVSVSAPTRSVREAHIERLQQLAAGNAAFIVGHNAWH